MTQRSAFDVRTARLGLCLAAVLAFSSATRAEPTAVIVTAVLDGDTVIVDGMRERIRLANVDAPERAHTGKPGQPAADQAWRALEAMVLRRQGVTMECRGEDRWQRPICTLWRDGENINRRLVLEGHAWANTAQRRYLTDHTMLDLQLRAQAARAGLWASPAPVPPWTWRRQCWEAHDCP